MSASGSAGPGFDPVEGVNFHLSGLNSKPFRSTRHTVLLIAIRPSNGDAKPGATLVLFETRRL